MIKVIAVPAFALLFMATPAPLQAQSVYSHIERQSYAGQQERIAKAKKAQRQRAIRRSPSGNPAYDVYVNGNYVGSDPDPRVRETLRMEARGGYGLRD